MWFIKKHHFNWLLFAIDVIVIGMVVGIALLVFTFFGNKKTANPRSTSSSSASAQIISPEDVTKNYFDALLHLDFAITEGNFSSDVFKKVEDVLLTVRVPRIMQEAHLRAVLLLGKLHAESGTLKNQDIQTRVQGILENLLKR